MVLIPASYTQVQMNLGFLNDFSKTIILLELNSDHLRLFLKVNGRFINETNYLDCIQKSTSLLAYLSTWKSSKENTSASLQTQKLHSNPWICYLSEYEGSFVLEWTFVVHQFLLVVCENRSCHPPQQWRTLEYFNGTRSCNSLADANKMKSYSGSIYWYPDCPCTN